MDVNIREIVIGLGIAVFIASFGYRFKAIHKYLANAGMLFGLLIVGGAFAWPTHSPLASERLPGFSSTFALKINDAAKLGNQYIFVFETPEKAKAAFYFSASGDRFVFL